MSAVIESTQESVQIKPERQSGDLYAVLKNGGRVLLLLAIAWLAFYAFYEAFPYIQNSTDVILDSKKDQLIHQWTYPEESEYRIYITGNSRILSGFIPAEFDSLDTETVYSLNAALPGSAEFLPELEGMVDRGEIPTHVFLTIPWSEQSLDNDLLNSTDKRLMDQFFPFNTLMHDIGLFLQRSLSHGGISEYYNLTRSEVESMIDSRGYLFIVTQSRYPDDILPEDYSEPSDTPNEPAPPRTVELEGEAFERLVDLHEQYGIQFVFVPTYARDSSRSAAPEHNEALEEVLADYEGFSVLGPDYVIYPHRYFADSVHLNPEGALIYTEMLMDLFEAQIYQAGE